MTASPDMVVHLILRLGLRKFWITFILGLVPMCHIQLCVDILCKTNPCCCTVLSGADLYGIVVCFKGEAHSASMLGTAVTSKLVVCALGMRRAVLERSGPAETQKVECDRPR